MIKSTIKIALKIVKFQYKKFTELNTTVVAIKADKVIVLGEDGKHYKFSGGIGELTLYEKVTIPRKYLSRIIWRRKLGL